MPSWNIIQFPRHSARSYHWNKKGISLIFDSQCIDISVPCSLWCHWPRQVVINYWKARGGAVWVGGGRWKWHRHCGAGDDGRHYWRNDEKVRDLSYAKHRRQDRYRHDRILHADRLRVDHHSAVSVIHVPRSLMFPGLLNDAIFPSRAIKRSTNWLINARIHRSTRRLCRGIAALCPSSVFLTPWIATQYKH